MMICSIVLRLLLETIKEKKIQNQTHIPNQ